jgi:hypothetical protein
MTQTSEIERLYIHRILKVIGSQNILQQIYWGLDDEEINIHGISAHIVSGNGRVSPNIIVNGSWLSDDQIDEAKNYLIKHNIYKEFIL